MELQEIRLNSLNRESNLLKQLRELLSELADVAALAIIAQWAQEHQIALKQVFSIAPLKTDEPFPPRRRRGRPKNPPKLPKPPRQVGFLGGTPQSTDLTRKEGSV